MASGSPVRKRVRTESHQLTISESFARRHSNKVDKDMSSASKVIDLSTPPPLPSSPTSPLPSSPTSPLPTSPPLPSSPTPEHTPAGSPLLFSEPTSPCSDGSDTTACQADSNKGTRPATKQSNSLNSRHIGACSIGEPSNEGTREKPSSSKQASLPTSRGAPLSDICFGPSAYPILQHLQASPTHSVLFRPRLKPGVPPKPFPDVFKDVWDCHHVRMPCSSQNLYPVAQASGEKTLLARWDLIKDALQKPILTSYDLEVAILSYNSRYSRRWDFKGLHTYFNEVAEDEERGVFFGSVLPRIIDLALALPTTVTHAVPLLKKQQNYSVTLSQQQIACLLANAFLCTFPRRNATQAHSEYSKYPSINFNELFVSSATNSSSVKVEKLKCILSYFTRVTSKMPEGVVTFSRQVCVDPPQWDKCTHIFTKLRVDSEGTIEDNGQGMLQVDFANRYVGGGVLGWGCVQEEIRFLISPELIVSRLFCEELDANECVMVTGAERYSEYRGYSLSFEWVGSCVDSTVQDRWGRRETQVVAIDALVFHSYGAQFKPGLLRRELNKAYCGYMHSDTTSCGRGMAIATGNWGCGAFGGNARLKALLQLMAASVADRDVVYFTFGDRQLQEDLFHMYSFITERKLSVSSLWTALLRYYADVVQCKGRSDPLYKFIMNYFTGGSSRDSQTLEYSL